MKHPCKKNNTLEICCYSVESAIIAEKAGAMRIELCENYSEGGTTPSYGSIKYTVENLKIPVNVIIRPRGGDFLYTDTEFEVIIQDVKMAKHIGANGVVVGFLDPDGNVDAKKTKAIIDIAKPMEITFHRAFDRCKDAFEALETLIDLGVDRILTSGKKQSACDGAELISKLIKQADNRIIIMPGSGVKDVNIAALKDKTQAVEFHSSAKTFIDSQMKYIDNSASMGSQTIDDNRIVSVNKTMIKNMADILKN